MGKSREHDFCPKHQTTRDGNSSILAHRDRRTHKHAHTNQVILSRREHLEPGPHTKSTCVCFLSRLSLSPGELMWRDSRWVLGAAAVFALVRVETHTQLNNTQYMPLRATKLLMFERWLLWILLSRACEWVSGCGGALWHLEIHAKSYWTFFSPSSLWGPSRQFWFHVSKFWEICFCLHPDVMEIEICGLCCSQHWKITGWNYDHLRSFHFFQRSMYTRPKSHYHIQADWLIKKCCI